MRRRDIPRRGTHVIETTGLPDGFVPPSVSLNPPPKERPLEPCGRQNVRVARVTPLGGDGMPSGPARVITLAADASISIGPVKLTPAAIAAMLGRCTACRDTGHVCENHPGQPWAGVSDAADACECGAGMPCRLCCDPIPTRPLELPGGGVA